MIHNPKYEYSGLTVILDKPSRFDQSRLISGFAGNTFDNFLHPIQRDNIQLRTLSETSSLLENTTCIIGLGDGCIGNLCSREVSLNEIRGYPLTYQGRNLILTYSPQDAHDRKDYENEDETGTEKIENESSIKGHGATRRRNWKWWMYNDFLRAKKLLKGDVRFHNPGEIQKCIAESEQGFNDLLLKLKTLKDTFLYLDIECDKNKVLTCLGVGFVDSNDNNQKKVYVVPWKQYNKTLFYTPSQCRRFIQALCIAMHNNTCVIHNSMFDLFMLCYYYKIPFPKRVFDTMLSWHRCYPEIEKSLGHLLSYLTWLPYHKSDGVYNPTSKDDDRKLWNYNADDIIAMMIAHQPLKDEITKLKVEESVTFVNSMVRPYLTMMFQGMKLNTEKMLQRFIELDFKKVQLQRCLQTITRHPEINPRSPKQINKYLYYTLGFNCPDDKAPTNEKTLLKLLGKEGFIPSVRLILEGRGTGKTASALKFNLYDRNNSIYNRLTCAYNLAGTDTFRLASKALLKFRPDKGFGTNCQNWDKKQRDLVEADTGKVLIQADQSGAEALIVAYLCSNGNFRSLFLNGIKPHVFVALHVFKDKWRKYSNVVDDLCKLTPAKLKQHPEFAALKDIIASSDDWEAKERYYFIAKMICHACNYGMKAPTFQMNVLQKSDGAITLSLRECQMFIGLYHSLFPELEIWHCHVRKALETRILTNLFGESRRFQEPTGDSLFKQGYAFVPQSTVGEITNRGIVNVQNRIDDGHIPLEYKLDLLQNGHDSILAQCNPEFKRECGTIIKEALQQKLISPRGEEFYMKAEVGWGFNWGVRNEKKNSDGTVTIKNPEGLRAFAE